MDTSHTLYFQQNIANVQPRPSLKKVREGLSLPDCFEGRRGGGGGGGCAQANKDKESNLLRTSQDLLH